MALGKTMNLIHLQNGGEKTGRLDHLRRNLYYAHSVSQFYLLLRQGFYMCLIICLIIREAKRALGESVDKIKQRQVNSRRQKEDRTRKGETCQQDPQKKGQSRSCELMLSHKAMQILFV